MMRIEHLKKQYGDNLVLNDISLSLDDEVTCILGPSGAGKSTFLRCLNLLESPTGGDIKYNGQSILQPGYDIRKMREEVTMVFQHFNLFPLRNVVGNVMLALQSVKHMKKADAHDIAMEILKKVDMADKAEKMPDMLSGGQQQRVAIARAVVNNPKVLLLDEPLGALDYKLRKKMQLELKNLQRGLGITFIYVTHDQEEALTMSDRVIIVKDGRIEQDDPPAAIYQYPKSQFAAGFIGENNFFDIEGDEDHVLAVRPQFIEVSKESEDLEGTPKEPFYYGSVVELLFTGTFDKVFIRLDNTNQMVTAYQYYDDKKRWKADDRVGIRWNAEEAVKVIK